MVDLAGASLLIVTKKEAVSAGCAERKGLTEGILEAVVAALVHGAGAIRDDLVVASDVRAVVKDYERMISDA